jgi:hypothetical protein
MMMKRKTMFLLLVLACVTVAILWGINSSAESTSDNQANTTAGGDVAEASENDTTKAAPEIIAYYFHTTYRCVSCKKIEAYSREAIETGFADELRSGTLKFESINIDDAGNKHFVEDYQLYTKSLVICNMEDGQQVEWKNLAKVWQLLRNKDAFVKYVQDEILAYLKES